MYLDNTNISNIRNNNNGNIQIDFSVNNQSYSVTFNPNNLNDMQNIYTMNVGDSGYINDVGEDLAHFSFDNINIMYIPDMLI